VFKRVVERHFGYDAANASGWPFHDRGRPASRLPPPSRDSAVRLLGPPSRSATTCPRARDEVGERVLLRDTCRSRTTWRPISAPPRIARTRTDAPVEESIAGQSKVRVHLVLFLRPDLEHERCRPRAYPPSAGHDRQNRHRTPSGALAHVRNLFAYSSTGTRGPARRGHVTAFCFLLDQRQRALLKKGVSPPIGISNIGVLTIAVYASRIVDV